MREALSYKRIKSKMLSHIMQPQLFPFSYMSHLIVALGSHSSRASWGAGVAGVGVSWMVPVGEKRSERLISRSEM